VRCGVRVEAMAGVGNLVRETEHGQARRPAAMERMKVSLMNDALGSNPSMRVQRTPASVRRGVKGNATLTDAEALPILIRR
jgi:hypothetical protein